MIVSVFQFSSQFGLCTHPVNLVQIIGCKDNRADNTSAARSPHLHLHVAKENIKVCAKCWRICFGIDDKFGAVGAIDEICACGSRPVRGCALSEVGRERCVGEPDICWASSCFLELAKIIERKRIHRAHH